MAHDPFPTLLNEYKYTLARRRLLRTLTGGIRIQNLPVSLHILQWSLWILPLLVSIPFIATGNAWNVYYLGLAYATCCGLITLSVGCTVKLLYWRLIKTQAHIVVNEEESTVFVPSFLSITFLSLVFARRNWIDVIVHAIVSSLTCFSSITLLNVFVMKDVVSVAATPFFFITGALTLCIAHYSLIARPPNELLIYRQNHQDFLLHLFYLRRPIYIVLIGVLFILLRISVGTSFLVIPYILNSLLPVLWSCGILPPLDALLFWLLEQILIHLMGGSATASELRIAVQFFIHCLILTTADGISFLLAEPFVTVLLAAGFGFLLSHGIIYWMTYSTTLIKSIINTSVLSSSWYTSYYLVDFRQVKMSWQPLVVSSLKSVVLVGIILIITSQTYGRGSGTPAREGVTVGVSYGIIVMFLLTRGLRVFAGAFICCGLVRNPFHVRKTEPLRLVSRSNMMSLWLSIPSQVLTIYVGPLLTVTYVGLMLDTTSNVIWFSLTAFRLYRKIWQNSSLSLTELSITAVLFLALSPNSSWHSLGIGNQALIISIMLYITNNFVERLKFFIVLLISFISSCSNNPVFHRCLVLSILLVPVSLVFLLLSAMLSAPLLPLFTLPILLMNFPRPQMFWPNLLDQKSLSQTYESSYYKQALPAISKSISHAFKNGTFHSVSPGTTLLVRFQDRLSLVRVVERGFEYCLIHIQGLELQETSCHTTEAASIDDIHETLYSSNNENRSCTSWFNRHPLYHLQPTGASTGRVYSDARNSLTGIIDRHDSLERFSGNLYKTLIWVFAGYSNETDRSGSRVSTAHAWNERTNGTEPAVGNHSDGVYGVNSVISPSHISFRSIRVHPAATPLERTALPSSLPLTDAELSQVIDNFPQEWFQLVISECCNVRSAMIHHLKKLVTTCFILSDIPASSTVFRTALSSRTLPRHIYEGFCGDRLPLTTNVDEYNRWMKDNSLVEELTSKAYRYAVKLLYDEVVLGDIADDSELIETLQDYDTNWYIGQEGSSEWERNVIRETRSLFSIGHTQNCYTAHVLTLQDEVMFVGQLNQSLIKGIWSNLIFELQYLTNDDEERYSIQAQPRLLRNLITQAAEVPYGYQIFSSELITIPTV